LRGTIFQKRVKMPGKGIDFQQAGIYAWEESKTVYTEEQRR
jgi:hypothetical protein